MKNKAARIILVFLSVLLATSVIVAKPPLADAQVEPLLEYLFPNAAYDPEFNRYLVVYQRVVHGELSSEYYVDGQFVRLDGTRIGDPFPISELGNSHHGSSIARGSDGRFLAVWDAGHTPPDPENPFIVDIIGQFVNPDGTLDGSNFVISNAVSFKIRPLVASGPDHARFLVVWDDDRNWETNSSDIYGQIVGEDGTVKETLSNENFAVTNAINSQYSPSLAYDTNNSRFLVAWGDTRSDVEGTNADVYGQLINPDWGGDPARGSHFLTASDVNFPICTEPTGFQHYPSIAFDAALGRFLVVWQDDRNADEFTYYDIYGQLVNGFDGGVDYYGGNPANGLLIVTASNDLYEPHVVKDDCNEGFLLVWGDNRGDVTYEIYGLLLDGNAAPNGNDFLVSQTEYDVGMMSVAVNGNCGALVAFQDPQPTGYLIGLATTGGLPDIMVTPSPIDFGEVSDGNSGTQEITIQNNGNVDLTLTSWEVLGTDAGMFGVVSGGSDPCGQTPVVLTPSSNCTLNVTFTPTSGGVKTATLRISSNDIETPTDVTLNGIGLVYPKVTVITPNGGEPLKTGEMTTIEWGAPATATKFKLFYSVDNGVTWVKITPDFVFDKSYPWIVPSLTANKKSCKVKVVGYKANGVSVGSDLSDAPFTIEVIKLTSPDGGNKLYSEATEILTWRVNATKEEVASVKLSYTRNNGITWLPIETLRPPITTPNSIMGPVWPPTSYEWTVPPVPATKSKCKVKIVLKSAKGVTLGSDMSDGVFTITIPN